MKFIFLPILALAPLAAFAGVNYSNDFQGAVGGEWSDNSTTDVNGAGRIGLGAHDNSSVTLTLSGFTVGQSASLTFDFYALSSWDGTGNQYAGPDRFYAKAGTTYLLDATFSNLDELGYQQSYSAGNPLGGGLVAAYTDADEIDTLSNYAYYGNSVYKFGGAINSGFSFIATSSTMVFTFGADGLQGLPDEGWAIDNVHVVQRGAATTPSPAALVPFLGGAAAAFRRRRRA